MWPSKPQKSPTGAKDLVEVTKNIATMIAMVVGGWWTYDVFVRERKNYPHANLELTTQAVNLNNASVLVRISANLGNTGSVRLKSSRNIVRVEQVLPLRPCDPRQLCLARTIEDTTQRASNAYVLMAKDRFPWPILGERDDGPGIDIEPGETEHMDFEFVVPKTAKVVRVYAYFRNDLKKGEGPEVGWSLSDLISLDREQKALP